MRVRTRIAAGSGVIIDPAGLVLTSAHLVGDSLSAQVLVDDTRTVIGTVIHLDELRDLALIARRGWAAAPTSCWEPGYRLPVEPGRSGYDHDRRRVPSSR